MDGHIYKKIELTGSSAEGIQKAIEKAIVKASKSVRNMSWFELIKARGHIIGSRIEHWQATVKIGFGVDDD